MRHLLQSYHPTFALRIALATAVLLGLVLVPRFTAGQQAGSKAKKDPPAAPTNIETGTGKQFRTTVETTSEGELSPEDFRQVSLLAARIIAHLNNAGVHLGNEQADQARQELEKGQELVKIVRSLLPTTVVKTIVRDSQGSEVYRYVDRVQEDRIPLHEGLIAVKTMEPIVDAKQDEAAIQGLRLADADLLHTSVLVELDYVESKLNRALALLAEKPQEALAQVALAQARGISFVAHKEDNPLVDAQLALQLAEQMKEQGRDQAAKANLQLARNHLEFYRTLLMTGQDEDVRKLLDEIAQLEAQIERKDAAGMIRGYWDRVTSWFSREPGEARSASEAGAESKKPQSAGTRGK